MHVRETVVTPAAKIFVLDLELCSRTLKAGDELKALIGALEFDAIAVNVVRHDLEVEWTRRIDIYIADPCCLGLAVPP